MNSDQQIIIASDQKAVIVENGPMRLVIKAWYNGVFQMDQVIQAAQFSFSCLEQVANDLPYLKQLNAVLPGEEKNAISMQMVKSVKDTGDKLLTPMAAVAGSIADAVADWLAAAGETTKVIVDNGGDISIRLRGSEKVSIGLQTDLNTPDISYIMELDAGQTSWGVNTSGMRGRSFTSGIASAATVIASTSSKADAAATSIANACFCRDENIVQVPARQIDPMTDIPDVPVTVQVGELAPGTFRTAVKRSLKKAEEYVKKGLIYGAVIAAGPYVAMTRRFNDTVASIKPQPGCCLINL